VKAAQVQVKAAQVQVKAAQVQVKAAQVRVKVGWAPRAYARAAAALAQLPQAQVA
jgi:hypothetical protein